VFDPDCEECRTDKEEKKSMTTDKVNLLARAEIASWPWVLYGGSEHMAGEQQWRAKVPDLMPLYVQQCASQVEQALLAQKRAEDIGEAVEAHADDRASRVPEYDPALEREEREAAQIDLDRYNRERPQRLEALLQRIADRLDPKRG
jgi:hypothetical protein